MHSCSRTAFSDTLLLPAQSFVAQVFAAGATALAVPLLVAPVAMATLFVLGADILYGLSAVY